MKVFKLFLTLGVLVFAQWGLQSAEASIVVQVLGKEVPSFVNLPISKIRLYVGDAQGQLRPIPFQIDEKVGGSKDGKRSWALDSDDPKDKRDGDGKLDSDEVILFLWEDAGSVVTATAFSAQQKVYELTVDTANQKKVYLTLEDSPPPIPAKSYVQYDVGKDLVTTYAYDIGFSAKKPFIQNLMVLKNANQPQNLLDRFKARFKLAVKGFITLKFDEEEISAKRLGYHWGPIRVIRSIQASKSLGPIKVIPKSRTDFFFYPDWVEVPTKINNPVDGPNFLSDKTEGQMGFDFNASVVGGQVFTNSESFNLQFAGKDEENVQKISGKDFKWWSLLTPNAGSMVVEIQNDSQLQQMGIYTDLVVADAAKRESPPEANTGEFFIGFELPYHKIPKGNYAVKVKQIFPKSLRHGQEAFYLGTARLSSPTGVKDLTPPVIPAP